MYLVQHVELFIRDNQDRAGMDPEGFMQKARELASEDGVIGGGVVYRVFDPQQSIAFDFAGIVGADDRYKAITTKWRHEHQR